MEDIKQLADSIYAEKVRRARRMTFEQKFLAGAELFDMACHIAESGIRSQLPGADDQQVRLELRRRLRIGRILEDRPASSRIAASHEQ